HLLDCIVQTLIEGDINIGRPDLLLQLLPRDHFTGVLNQHGKYSKRLVLQLDLHAGLMQLSGLQVELKYAESDLVGDGGRRWHSGSVRQFRLPQGKDSVQAAT